MEQDKPLTDFICCNRKFVFKEVMNMHIDVMHSKPVQTKLHAIHKKENNMDTLSCPYLPCKFHCKKKSFLTKHRKTVHESITMEYSKTCPTCGITLGKNTPLQTHIRNQHTGPVHQCSKCSYTNRNISYVKWHFKCRHTESMNKSCEFCGKVVKRLKDHLKVTMCGKDVDNRKMMRCPKCDIKMMGNWKLQKHIQNIHDRVNDISCPNCSYKTYSRFNLRLHVSKVHDKSTIFRICPHCQVRTGNIEAHLATYHSEQI